MRGLDVRQATVAGCGLHRCAGTARRAHVPWVLCMCMCSALCAGRLDSTLNGWRSARAACHARASCSAGSASCRREAAGAQCGARGLNVQNRQGCCAGCMQTAQQPCSGNGERARWPARAACRRARLAVKRPAGRDALRCGMVPEEGAGACAMGVDLSERCTAARASRREWSCAWLW